MQERPLPGATERLEPEFPDVERHLDATLRQFSDPEVARWHWPEPLGGPRTREECHEKLIGHGLALASGGVGYWWWRERTSGQLVAFVGLQASDVEGTPEVEIGWSVPPVRQGEGFATEAATSALRWGFEVARLERIVSFTQPHNRASRAVMERIGMRYERNFERSGFEHVLYGSPAPR